MATGAGVVAASTENINEAVKHFRESLRPRHPLSLKRLTDKLRDVEADSVNGDEEESHWFFFNSTRYIVMLVSVLCFTFVLSNSLALNFTIICMMPSDNDTSPAALASPYAYTPLQQSWLFSVVAIGNILGAIPLTFLSERLGMRLVFTVYGLISVVATLLTPLSAAIGFLPLLLMRGLQGFAVSVTLPALGSIVNAWSTLRGSGMFIAVLSCHLQFASIMMAPMAGTFCSSSIGWEAVFYLLGGLTLASYVLFFAFFRDSPDLHRNVSAKELRSISKGKTSVEMANGERPPVPYRAICTDLPVIGIWVSSFGGFICFQLFMLYGPIYLNKVLGMDVRSTGFMNALPYVGSLVVKLIAGPFSDYAVCISEKARVIIFATVSQITMGVCIIVLGWLPHGALLLAQIAFTLAIIFSGLNVVGVTKSAQLLSRQYCYVIMTVISFINSATVVSLPLIINFLAPNNAPHEWARIFFLMGGLIIVCTIFFDVTCETEPRPWTMDASLSRKSTAPVFEANTHPIVGKSNGKDEPVMFE